MRAVLIRPVRAAALELTPLDGLFASKVLSCTYLFPQRLDTQALEAAVRSFVADFPWFSGRLVQPPLWRRLLRSPFAGFRVAGDRGVPFRTGFVPGQSSADVAGDVDPVGVYVDVPSSARVLSGDAPVMTVTVTDFEGGGSALGVAISHALVDGRGLHAVVAELEDRFIRGSSPSRGSDGGRGHLCEVAKRVPASSTSSFGHNATFTDLTAFPESLLFSLSTSAASSSSHVQARRRRRAHLHISASELRVIKDKAVTAGAGLTCSTQAATSACLVAELCRVLAEVHVNRVATSSNQVLELRAEVGMAVDARPFVSVKDQVANLPLLLSMTPLGPESLVLDVQAGEASWTSWREDLTDRFRRTGDVLRAAKVEAQAAEEDGESSSNKPANLLLQNLFLLGEGKLVKTAQSLLIDADEEASGSHDDASCGQTAAKPSMSLDVSIWTNWQRGFPMRPTFDSNRCLRAVPAESDTIHVIPAAGDGDGDGDGGLEVYISPPHAEVRVRAADDDDGTAALLTPTRGDKEETEAMIIEILESERFKQRLLAGGGAAAASYGGGAPTRKATGVLGGEYV